MPPTACTETIDPADHLRLAKDYIKKRPSHGLDPDDMLSACYYGLVRAAREYDGKSGTFSTYAYWKMFGEVVQDAEILTRPMRIRHESIRRAKSNPDTPASRAVLATLEACTHHLPISEESRETISVAHLFEPADRSADSDPEVAAIMAEDRRERESLMASVDAAIGRITERERVVLTRMLGLDGSPPAGVVCLARELGISYQRVQQIYRHAIGRIRIELGVAS